MILITGLTGTSGSAFYDVLCREKYAEKIRMVTRGQRNMQLLKNSPLNLEVLQGDIQDVDFLTEAMEGCDTVFHLAGKEKADCVAEAIGRSPQVRYAIMVSSTIVYSEYYATSRLNVIEPKMRQLFRDRGVKYVFIRPTMIFGTPTDSNISVFIRWLKKYPVFPLVKHGSATLQPVSRLDLAEAYWTVLKNINTLQREEYVVSGREEMTLLEMLQTLSDLLGKKVRFINIPFPLAKFLVDSVYFLTFKRKDFREKLDRLTENRAYGHEAFTGEFGYDPPSFAHRAKPLVEAIKKEK